MANPRLSRFVQRFMPPWLALLLGLLFTLVIWQITAQQSAERAQLRFGFETQQLEEAILARLALHESVLRGARGRLGEGTFIAEDDWRQYVRSLNLQQRYPGLETIGLALRVRARDRELYQRTMDAMRHEEHRIWPEGERDEYFPVTYVEPAHPCLQQLIGFDMWSDPQRRTAMQHARDTAQVAITERVRVPYGALDAEYGFLMFLPMYATSGSPSTPDPREAQLLAFIFSPYAMTPFMEGLLNETTRKAVSLRIYDGEKPDPAALMYDSRRYFDPSPLDHSPAMELVRTLQVSGVQWTLAFASTALLEQAYGHQAQNAVLVLGGLLSLFLFALTRNVTRARVRAQEAARRASQQLRLSEARFMVAAESANDAIISADENGRIVYFNPAAERLYGYRAREIIGRSLMTLSPQSERSQHLADYQRYMQENRSGIGTPLEALAQRKDGSTVPVELTVSRWQTEEGAFVTVIARDISVRREAEESVRRMNEELERRVEARTAELQRTLEEYERADQFRASVMDNAVVGLLTVTSQGLMATTNSVFCEMVGYGPEELSGQHWSMLTGKEATEALMPQVRALTTAQQPICNQEVDLIRKDGGVVNVVFGANPLRVRGELLGSVVSVLDISQRKKAEAQVRELNAELEGRAAARTEQLRAANVELESLSYSLSHDLRAPLRHVDGHVQMLLEESGTTLDAQQKQRLQRIAQAAQHMGQLIDDLLRFLTIGQTRLRQSEVDMALLVERARNMLADEVKDRHIDWVIDPLPTVRGDERLLFNVWLNLLSNALKYTSGRTLARIEIRARRTPQAWLFSVCDNGVGYDMRYADRLYRVFERLHPGEFTGTGIGLASVHRIVQRHGGRSWTGGQVDAGAAFHFSLPHAD